MPCWPMTPDTGDSVLCLVVAAGARHSSCSKEVKLQNAWERSNWQVTPCFVIRLQEQWIHSLDSVGDSLSWFLKAGSFLGGCRAGWKRRKGIPEGLTSAEAQRWEKPWSSLGWIESRKIFPSSFKQEKLNIPRLWLLGPLGNLNWPIYWPVLEREKFQLTSGMIPKSSQALDHLRQPFKSTDFQHICPRNSNSVSLGRSVGRWL